MYLVTHSFDPRFVSLLGDLRKTYGERMFELEGIGSKDLDINHFSKQYYTAKSPAADNTIDSNANVDDTSVVTWEKEAPKPILKLNSLYMLWKDAEEKMGIKRANKMIEGEIAGWFRIHDLYKWLFPYCASLDLEPLVSRGMPFYPKIKIGPIKHFYAFVNVVIQYVCFSSNHLAGACLHRDSRVVVKRNGNIYKESIGSLVDRFNPSIKIDAGGKNWMYSTPKNVEVWEEDKFVPLLKVMKRPYAEDILRITTKGGKTVKTSKEHRFKVLYRGRLFEVPADQLKVGDTVIRTEDRLPVDQTSLDYKEGAFYGVIAGDGNLTEPHCVRVSVNDKQTFIMDFMDTVSENMFGKKGARYSGHRCKTWALNCTEALRKIKTVLSGTLCYDKNIDLSGKSLDFKAGFLDGLCVTDGGYNHGVCLTLSNKALIDTAAGVVDELMGPCPVRVVDYNDGRRKQAYSIYIPSRVRTYLSLFNERVKNRTAYKNSPLVDTRWFGPDATLKVGSAKIRTTEQMRGSAREHRADVVVDISRENNTDPFVYELETGSHWYSAEGLLTHNCALPNLFPYMDYFIRKDYGEKWHEDKKTVDFIKQALQSFIYSLNFNYRSNQTSFSNVSVYDDKWLEAMFSNHMNPDHSRPDFENIKRLQKLFVDEMLVNLKDNPFTFPVMTACMLYDKGNKKFFDMEFAEWVADVNKDTGLFNMYVDDDTASLSMCCRLKNNLNKLKDARKEYANTFGVGGLQIGSHRVVALNLVNMAHKTGNWEEFKKELAWRVDLTHDILDTHRAMLQKLIDDGRLPLYTYKFMFLKRQYSTVGFIGMHEALKLLGFDVLDKTGSDKAVEIVELINNMNTKREELTGNMYNVEQVPGEAAASNLASKDALQFPDKPTHQIYSNQYIPLSRSADLADRIRTQGLMDKRVSGGSILHVNVDEHLTKRQVLKIMLSAADKGVVYFAINLSLSKCKSCGRVHAGRHDLSPCHKSQTLKYLRVVGYMTPVDTWGAARREEYKTRQFYSMEAFG